MDQKLMQWVPVTSKRRDDFLTQCRQAFEEGHLRPGQRLPNERQLAEQVGLSRSTIRSAFGVLEAEGLIVRYVGRGTFVAGMVEFPKSEIVEWTPAQLMEFRLHIEPSLTDLIVLSASHQELDALSVVVDEGRHVRDWQAAEHSDRSFHSEMFRLTGNGIFADLGRQISGMRDGRAWMQLKESSFSAAKWEVYQGEHEFILTALKERNAETARDALRQHLGGVRARTILTG